MPDSEVAFVTGAGSGIGRATALRLAARGARLGLFDISAAGLRETVAEIRQAGGPDVPRAGRQRHRGG